MDNLIDLNIYGTTCHMRLYADRLVVMSNNYDFKRLVKMIVMTSDGEHHDNLAKLQYALLEQKKYLDNAKPYAMTKTVLKKAKASVERRIRETEEIVDKFKMREVWNRL